MARLVVQLAVDTVDKDGWKGANHLPTFEMCAPTEGDARARVQAIVDAIPGGRVVSMCGV
jgi:hypothetical protein